MVRDVNMFERRVDGMKEENVYIYEGSIKVYQQTD